MFSNRSIQLIHEGTGSLPRIGISSMLSVDSLSQLLPGLKDRPGRPEPPADVLWTANGGQWIPFIVQSQFFSDTSAPLSATASPVFAGVPELAGVVDGVHLLDGRLGGLVPGT